jgi:hypothetical protein
MSVFSQRAPRAPRFSGRISAFLVLAGLVIGALLLFWLLPLGGYPAVWLFPSSEWANRWRYAFDDDINGAMVAVTPVPHDCEFLTAPMGSKHCHYGKAVVIVRVRTGETGRVVSYDEGKTWAVADAADKRGVFVTWNKIED